MFLTHRRLTPWSPIDVTPGERPESLASIVGGCGQGLGGSLGRLAHVDVDRLASDAGGELVEVGVEFFAEREELGPECARVEFFEARSCKVL
jgi:hypothetical protein